jgi:very-short-patch-repair endonuclease
MESRRGTKTSRQLRSASTDAERALWERLRSRRLGGLKFRRQFAISGYVADFACLEARIVVEVDGGQHNERQEQDAHRTAILAKSGFRVLRFWDNDVLKELEAVLEEILRAVETPPSPQPSPADGQEPKCLGGHGWPKEASGRGSEGGA